MKLLANSNFQSLIVLSILGYVLLLLIGYLESLLLSIAKMIAFLLLNDSWFFNFYEILPKLLAILMWAIFVFKYLDNFSGQINLSADLTRKFGIRLIILVGILALARLGMNYLTQYLFNLKKPEYTYDYEMITIKGIIFALLGLIEIAIIAVGYFKILKKVSTLVQVSTNQSASNQS